MNLLPKKPFWTVWFVPLLGGLLAVYVCSGALIWFGLWSSEAQTASNEAEIELTRQRIEELRKERVPDPMLAVFDGFKRTVSLMESSRTDWFPPLQAVSGMLPDASRMRSAGDVEEEEGALELQADFGTLRALAEYIRNTRASGLFEEVRIDSLSMREVFTPAPTAIEEALAPVAEHTTESAPGATARPVGLAEWSEDPGIRGLQWLIMQQAAKQQFGYELQPEPLEMPDVPPELLDAFTEEDLERAWEAVEEFKTQDVYGDGDSADRSEIQIPSIPVPADPEQAAPAQQGTTQVYYEVTLRFLPAVAKEESKP